MNTKKSAKRMVAIDATPEEIKMIDRIKRVLKRSSYSDLIRFLVNEKYDQIFCADK